MVQSLIEWMRDDDRWWLLPLGVTIGFITFVAGVVMLVLHAQEVNEREDLRDFQHWCEKLDAEAVTTDWEWACVRDGKIVYE